MAAGAGVLAPAVTRSLFAEFAASVPAERPPGADELTQREREVLACLGEGLSNQQIAARLYVGETTVKTHVSRVLSKLQLRSRVQAAIVARELQA